MNTTLEVLKRARRKIENRDNWTKHTLAADMYGEAVDVTSPLARCFCSIGACFFAAEVDAGTVNAAVCHATDALQDALPRRFRAVSGGIAAFNDHPKTTHKDVLALFDRAIANLERRAAA